MLAPCLSLRISSTPCQESCSTQMSHLSDGSEVEAPKLILALASPVFEMEFYGGQWAEQGRDRLDIVDDRGVFRKLVSFVYKQDVDFSCVDDLQLWDLLYLANKYLVKHLRKMVEEKIVNCLKTCQHKPDLLNHWQRSKENILGDQFITLLKAEIEVFDEAVFSSEERVYADKFLNTLLFLYSALFATG